MVMALVSGGCAFLASAPPENVDLRPAPSRIPTYTVSGQTIIATPGPVSVATEPLVADQVQRYFRGRPTRVNPFQEFEGEITAFFVRIENRSKDQAVFDPGAAILKDDEDRSARAWGIAELHEIFSDRPQLLQAALKGVITSYLVIPAEKSQEGLLIFPAFAKDAKAVFLQLTSLYAGPTPTPLIFEFTVVPEKSKSKS
jgi:hypothetical protein